MNVERVLIRADAGQAIGSGHVIRCLTLASLLRERGMEITFVVRDDVGASIDRIRSADHQIAALPSMDFSRSLLDGALSGEDQHEDLNLVTSLVSGTYHTVIVDHYGLDARWEEGIRAVGTQIVALDDIANRAHAVDVLVDQNWYGPSTADRYLPIVDEDCLQLLGPRYAILQSEYAVARASNVHSGRSKRRVLISFGGSDPTGETARVVSALASPEFADIAIAVVLGSRSVLTADVRTALEMRPDAEVHIGLPTLDDLLSNADLAVGASGAGTWERMCLGVPALVTTTTPAHSGVTEALANAGLTTWAGIGGQVTTERYHELLAQQLLSDSSPRELPLVDGFGADRIAETIFGSRGSVHIGSASPLDAPQFLGVDPGGPAGAGRQLAGPEVWSTELARFESDMVDPDQLLLVPKLGSLPLGRVRALSLIHISEPTRR